MISECHLRVLLTCLCKKAFRLENVETEPYQASGRKDHVIIVGSGRVGVAIASILTEFLIPFVMIEYNLPAFLAAKQKGYPIIFGDAAVQEVYDTADPADAQLTLVTAPATTGCFPLIQNIRARYSSMKIIASVNSDDQIEQLKACGVDVMINPVLEASLEMTRLALEHFDVEDRNIGSMLSAYRVKQYTSGQLLPHIDETEGK